MKCRIRTQSDQSLQIRLRNAFDHFLDLDFFKADTSSGSPRLPGFFSSFLTLTFSIRRDLRSYAGRRRRRPVVTACGATAACWDLQSVWVGSSQKILLYSTFYLSVFFSIPFFSSWKHLRSLCRDAFQLWSFRCNTARESRHRLVALESSLAQEVLHLWLLQWRSAVTRRVFEASLEISRTLARIGIEWGKNIETDWKLVLKESHVRSKGIEIVPAFRDVFVHLIMLRLNLSTHTSRSIWHVFSPASLLSSPSFIQIMSKDYPKIQCLLASHLFHVFKGDKLAWGSKKRSEGDHDCWQWHPRGCCERQTGRVFEIFTFSSDAVTFHNFEHLTFPSLSFLSFLTYWIVSKKFHLTPTKLQQKILHFANNWRGFGAMVRGPRFIYLEELAELVFETTSQEATTGASFFLGRFRNMWLYVSMEAKPSAFFLFTWLWTG